MLVQMANLSAPKFTFSEKEVENTVTYDNSLSQGGAAYAEQVNYSGVGTSQNYYQVYKYLSPCLYQISVMVDRWFLSEIMLIVLSSSGYNPCATNHSRQSVW